MAQGISPIGFGRAEYSVVSATTSNSGAPNHRLGDRIHHDGDDYVYVYNTSATQISQGQCALLAASSLTSGFSVTVSNAVSQAGANLVVGVAKHATIAAGDYGWVMTRGLCSPALDSAELTLTSGSNVTVGLNGGFVTHLGSAHTGVLVYPFLGVALSTCPTALTTTGKIRFRSPLFG